MCALAVLVSLATAAPARAANLFALVDTGELFVSEDDGASWAVRATLPVHDAVGLVAGASTADLTLASATGTIYTSIDAGTSWTATGSVAASDVVGLHMRPSGALLVLTRAGLLFGSPDAVSFDAVATLPASDLAGLSRRPGPIYALAESGTVFRSDDDGTTWSTTGTITATDAVDVVSLVDDVFAITSTGSVWSSTDGGASFDVVATLSQVHTSGFVRSAGDGHFYATTREGEIARSSDGLSWTWVGTTNQLDVVALATDDTIVGVTGESDPTVPLAIGHPTPNPVRARHASVSLDVASASGTLALVVVDVAGRLVHASSFVVAAGTTRLGTGVSDLAPGVYFLRATMGEATTSTRRFVVLP